MLKLRNSIFLLLIFTSLVMSSCKRHPEGILTSSEMQDVLLHVHMLDGILSTGNFRYLTAEKKAQYYNSILQERGFTKEQYDTSLVWYTANPELFEKIYVKVNENLAEIEKDVMLEEFTSIDPHNTTPVLASESLWKKSKTYSFDEYVTGDSLTFVFKDMILLPSDLYRLAFRYIIEENDSCPNNNNQVKFNIHYEDNYVDSIRHSLVADGRMHRFTMCSYSDRWVKIDSLSGVLIDFDSCDVKRNVFVGDIAIIREYTPAKTDSIQNRLQFLKAWRDLNNRVYQSTSNSLGLFPESPSGMFP